MEIQVCARVCVCACERESRDRCEHNRIDTGALTTANTKGMAESVSTPWVSLVPGWSGRPHHESTMTFGWEGLLLFQCQHGETNVGGGSGPSLRPQTTPACATNSSRRGQDRNMNIRLLPLRVTIRLSKMYFANKLLAASRSNDCCNIHV